MTDLPTLIAQVGFPIAVAIYTLVRLDASLRDNTDALKDLAAKIGGGDRGSK